LVLLSSSLDPSLVSVDSVYSEDYSAGLFSSSSSSNETSTSSMGASLEIPIAPLNNLYYLLAKSAGLLRVYPELIKAVSVNILAISWVSVSAASPPSLTLSNNSLIKGWLGLISRIFLLPSYYLTLS